MDAEIYPIRLDPINYGKISFRLFWPDDVPEDIATESTSVLWQRLHGFTRYPDNQETGKEMMQEICELNRLLKVWRFMGRPLSVDSINLGSLWSLAFGDDANHTRQTHYGRL